MTTRLQEDIKKSTNKIPIIVPVIAIAAMFMIPVTYKQYSLHSEIHDFSYQALAENIERYPKDSTFISQIRESIDDGKINGKEHKVIVERLLEVNGVYHGAAIGTDHSNAKQLLVAKLDKIH